MKKMMFTALAIVAITCLYSVAMAQEPEFVEARRLALAGENQENNPGLYLPIAAYDVELSGNHMLVAGTENVVEPSETYAQVFSLFYRTDSLERLAIEEKNIPEYIAFVSNQLKGRNRHAACPYILLVKNDAGNLLVARVSVERETSLNSFNEEIWSKYPNHAGSSFYAESPNPADWSIDYLSLDDHCGPLGYYPTVIVSNLKDLPSDVYTIAGWNNDKKQELASR